MLQKETRVTKEKAVTRRKQNFIQRYFNETIGELRKVSWPTRKEAFNLTIIVLVVMVLMSLVLGLLDGVYSYVFRLFLA
jgi:preprotein translocase subunit SecE